MQAVSYMWWAPLTPILQGSAVQCFHKNVLFKKKKDNIGEDPLKFYQLETTSVTRLKTIF